MSDVRWFASMLILLSGCGTKSGSSDPIASAGGGATAVTVELGVPGGSDGLDFAPFEDGSELRLHTFGQGGTHVLLGVRCTGFGTRAFVALTAKNLNDGNETTAPAPVRPQLFLCNGDVCDLVPMTMMMGGLAQTDAERDGLPVQITARVSNTDGASGEDSLFAHLSTADL